MSDLIKAKLEIRSKADKELLTSIQKRFEEERRFNDDPGVPKILT